MTTKAKVKAEGVKMSITRYAIVVNGRRWEGDTIAGMKRDLEEAFPVNGGAMDVTVNPKPKRSRRRP